MELEIESLVDTVITIGYLDNFTAREITIGLCCLTKTEHCELKNIQKRVSAYLEKLADNDLLESISENNQPNVYKKTKEFHIYASPLETSANLKIQFIKECQAQRDNCTVEMSECSSAMRVYSKLCGNSHNLKELMRPAYALLEEQHNFLINKIKIIDNLLDIYDSEVGQV